MENHDTKQIEKMLEYFFDNFDTIQKLVERERNSHKQIFGFRAGSVFNPTGRDLLWGLDAPPAEEAKVKPTAIDLYSLPETQEEKD